MKPNLIINTHGNSVLNAAVQAALTASNPKLVFTFDRQASCFPFIGASGDMWLHARNSDADFGFPGESIQIDAATEMGKLIELLETPKEVEILNVAYDGSKNHSGIISPDGKTVKVGCSTSTYEKVEEVYLKMKSLRQ